MTPVTRKPATSPSNLSAQPSQLVLEKVKNLSEPKKLQQQRKQGWQINLSMIPCIQSCLTLNKEGIPQMWAKLIIRALSRILNKKLHSLTLQWHQSLRQPRFQPGKMWQLPKTSTMGTKTAYWWKMKRQISLRLSLSSNAKVSAVSVIQTTLAVRDKKLSPSFGNIGEASTVNNWIQSPKETMHLAKIIETALSWHLYQRQIKQEVNLLKHQPLGIERLTVA